VSVDQTLAQWSNTLVYSAMLVYTGALGASTTDLAIRGRRRAEEAAAALAASPAQADAEADA